MTSLLTRTLIQRLSLRHPQAASLEILADVIEKIGDLKNADPVAALATIRSAYSSVEEFEREFPSLCFALATGVGKTRLMGAFIAYLYLSKKSRHFFVLAPNKTIYDKLIADFSPESPKYVFKGIAEFAQRPPLIVTGDNYETGIGVRFETGRHGVQAEMFDDVHINIFNIDKINKEESPRGKPKMKRLQETIGESYYEYLSQLDDLVLLMDEAHRYRGSAGAKAINELKPILGLELTATPKTVGTGSRAFKNVIFDYGLGQAMEDGFVKEPAVATRANFDPTSVDTAQLEKIKLEDAVHYHDHVSVELDRYHRISGRKKVHPFILVVAQNTDHSGDIKKFIESEAFFEGRFKDKVIEVHSNQTGSESDEAMARLVALETDSRTEIVIHVNKLKEGWDVTNLYTIVPLRASASDILTEQTLGRGLRLPYGIRVARGDAEEFASVDRLTVIAHDRFDEIINKARDPSSIVHMKSVVIGDGGDVSLSGTILIETPSFAEMIVTGVQPSLPGLVEAKVTTPFKTPEETQAANITLQVIQKYERKVGTLGELASPEIQKKIAAEVEELTKPLQATLEGVTVKTDVTKIVQMVTGAIAEKTISIPKIVVLPKKTITFHFDDFDLKDLTTINHRPISDELLVETMRTGTRQLLARTSGVQSELRPEDYIVHYIFDRPEVDYDANSGLLYKLAGQMVSRIRSYLATDAEVDNVLISYGQQLADFIFAQMMQHYRETPLGSDDYEVRVTHGFTMLRPQPFNVPKGQSARDFKQPITPASDTRRHVFAGFTKCCYPLQRFDSDPERRFATLLDGDKTVDKWMKPGKGQLQISYRSGESYEPDFVVETIDRILLCEVKAHSEMSDPTVLAKAQAASKWCETASTHARKVKSKPWGYLLIPDDQIIGSATLNGLAAKFATA